METPRADKVLTKSVRAMVIICMTIMVVLELLLSPKEHGVLTWYNLLIPSIMMLYSGFNFHYKELVICQENILHFYIRQKLDSTRKINKKMRGNHRLPLIFLPFPVQKLRF